MTKCAECHYCDWDDEENRGFCHYYPPQIVGRVLTYAPVDENDWCGQFRPELNS